MVVGPSLGSPHGLTHICRLLGEGLVLWGEESTRWSWWPRWAWLYLGGILGEEDEGGPQKKEKKRKTKAEETVHVNGATWVAHPSNTLDTPLARGGLEPWGNV